MRFFSPHTIVFGIGSIGNVVQEIRRLSGTKVLLVTDPGVVAAGLSASPLDLIRAADIAVDVFSDVNPDPHLNRVEACAAVLRKGRYDLVIGLGGGSPIDVAKYASAWISHSGSVRDYLGRELLQRKGLPTILIPTTAGTGSEVTWAAVFHDEADHVKKAVWSPYVQADTVIVDPGLTLSMPVSLTIDTGMDALFHAMEAYVARDASPLTDGLAIEAIRLINKGFRVVVRNGRDLEARSDMAFAATLAGLAFSNAGLGALHALALLLDGEFSFTHGRSLAVLAPHVLEFNLIGNPGKYAQMAAALGQGTEGMREMEAARKVVEAISRLASDHGVSLRLRDYGIPSDRLEEMGKRAFEIGQRHLPMNPRPLSREDAVRIYQEAY